MTVRQLPDGRWQVMRDDGASLALTFDEWCNAMDIMDGTLIEDKDNDHL